MIDKLIAILSMMLLAIITLYIVIFVLEKEKKDKNLEKDMDKFEKGLKKKPLSRGENAIVDHSDIRELC